MCCLWASDIVHLHMCMLECIRRSCRVSDMLYMLPRFFYASSACIYPENKQLDTEVEGGGLKEKDAWPAQVFSFTPLLVHPWQYHQS